MNSTEKFEHTENVYQASKICLVTGALTLPLVIGYPFLIATFVLGIYLMTLGRRKQGVLISIGAAILFSIIPLLFYFLVVFGFTSMLF